MTETTIIFIYMFLVITVTTLFVYFFVHGQFIFAMAALAVLLLAVWFIIFPNVEDDE